MIALLLTKQIIILFLMMMCGFALVKARVLRTEDSKALSIVVLYLVMPCVIVNSFQIEYTQSIRNGFLLALLAALIIHIVLLVVTWLLGKLLHFDGIEKASLIYSNSGSLIVPLVSSLLGEEWVIYSSGFLCVQLFFIWTHGKALIEEKRSLDLKKILLNINMISIFIGVILFFARIELPSVIKSPMSSFASMVGPLSMLMIGMLLAGVKWSEVFAGKRIYLIAFLKMIALPLLILLLLRFSGLSHLSENGETILLISLLAVITPSATTVTQMAQFYDRNAPYAGAINVLTTVVCILTMPLMVLMYSL